MCFFIPYGNYVHAVDLGLSVKWACCNVGASSPEEYGGYYAWGETSEKSEYNWETYFDWVDKDGNGGYGCTITTDIAGTEYDVAHVKWGGSWRMPTWNEILELLNDCTWQWTTVNGVYGQKVTGPNGNSIFLPAAGMRFENCLSHAGSFGEYWSSTLHRTYSDLACFLGFDYGYYTWGIHKQRYSGLSVRPVSD